jgi:hypothetical protein
MANRLTRGIREPSVPAYIKRLLKRWADQPGGVADPANMGVVHQAENNRAIAADGYGDPMAEPDSPDFLREVNAGWTSVTRSRR